ncbi:MAG: class I SAM-dependent methyltransferase [Acidobacteria bacterium]|uniref:Class I SAM-dependent methyltransferase n=1 Tax=Candidatus Polarisedimenticola svalbardensis TaxID=2886004 RepID=A0A8J6Y037_9BACT|nr:class I SAM-dependent methyltransferase [Candidatus Polarisedimenticola svalbardensis]
MEYLTEFIQLFKVAPRKARVLDIGCGSGFYADFWKNYDIEHYTGVDVSPAAITRLQDRHPYYRFQVQDISHALPDSMLARPYDIVTCFDVLYHIVNDQLFEKSVANIGRLIKPGGYFLAFEQFSRQSYSPSAHVKFRNRSAYSDGFTASRLSVVHSRHLFQLLVPPLFGTQLLDVPIAGIYKLAGQMTISSESFGRFAGRSLLGLDRVLLRCGSRLPNNEFICFQADPDA